MNKEKFSKFDNIFLKLRILNKNFNADCGDEITSGLLMTTITTSVIYNMATILNYGKFHFLIYLFVLYVC